jgi:hypothetical protein
MEKETYENNGISEIFKFVKSDFTKEDWAKLIEFYSQGETDAELV